MKVSPRTATAGVKTDFEHGVRSLLDAHCPTSALHVLIEAGYPAQSAPLMVENAGIWVCLAETLVELDRASEALALLEDLVEKFADLQLSGEYSRAAARSHIVMAQLLLSNGQVDKGILAALTAEEIALAFHGSDVDDLGAWAQIWCAVGYAMKRCFALSDSYLHSALESAPTNPRVLAGYARLRIELDQRLPARRIYARMAELVSPWAKPYAAWGLAHIAYLLGEFDQAESFASQALSLAPEMVMPLYVLAQTALARSDAAKLQETIKELDRRSSYAEMLQPLRAELRTLGRRLGARPVPKQDPALPAPKARRLDAFPTLIQYQDTCGPAVVELVLRYWAGSSGSPPRSDDIALKIKYPHAGTPIYRMREYFHLYGYDTVRCQAGIPILKKLVDSGLPAIIQQEYSNTAHVSVVIGYDEAAGLVDLQDPMTHVVLSVPEEEINRLRKNYLDAALIAYPRNAGHERTLSLLGVYNNPILEAADRVILEFDQGRFAHAADLLETNVRRRPEHVLSWILLLHARNEILADQISSSEDAGTDEQDAARTVFYACLERAGKNHPKSEFLRQFEGWGALHDRDYARARLAFRAASKGDPEDARNHAFLAECLFALQPNNPNSSGESALFCASQSLQHDSSLLAGNIWMARSLIAESGWVRGRSTTAKKKASAWSRGETRIGSALRAAWHYARSAVALDSKSGMAHLALAEVLWVLEQLDLESGTANTPSTPNGSAWEEIELALALSPGLPGAVLLRAVMVYHRADDRREMQLAYTEMERLASQERYDLDRLRKERTESARAHLRRLAVPSTALLYGASQNLIEFDLQRGDFNQAAQHIEEMLEDFPEDAWALSIRASVFCERFLSKKQEASQSQSTINNGNAPSPSIFQSVQSLFSDALRAAPGDVSLLEDYLHYQEMLAGSSSALAAFDQIINGNNLSNGPFAAQSPRLHYLRAHLLAELGDVGQATDHFLMALAGPNGVQDNHELFTTITYVIETLGVEEAVEVILDFPEVAGVPPLDVRRRTLGLGLLTQLPDRSNPAEQERRVAIGRQLLGEVLQVNPDDAQAALVLGHASFSPADREALYRRALMIAPGWAQARAALADFLTETGRPDQALDLTRGYASIAEGEPAERHQVALDSAHGRALLGAGLFEEAVQIFSRAIDLEESLQGQLDQQDLPAPVIWLYVGRWQAEMGSGQAAIALKTARKALRLSKDHPGHEAAWFLRLATSLRRLGRFDEASRAVERGRLHGLSDLDVLRAGYETALARNNLADAMNALDSYIRLDFNEQGVGGFLNGRLGWAEAERLRLLIKIGRSDEAVSFLEKMQLDAEGWGQAAWNLVLTDSGVQSDTLALQAADQALSLDAANHAGLFTRAEALGSLGREPEAVQAWVALRDAHPEDHTAYEKLALRLALSGDLPQALQFADRSIALGAFCPFSWAARGVVHFFGGHSEEALADLQLAWNRADVQQRRKNQVFWRLLSMLWMRQRGSRPGELMSLENQAEADGLRPFDVRLLKGIQTKISIHNRKQN